MFLLCLLIQILTLCSCVGSWSSGQCTQVGGSSTSVPKASQYLRTMTMARKTSSVTCQWLQCSVGNLSMWNRLFQMGTSVAPTCVFTEHVLTSTKTTPATATPDTRADTATMVSGGGAYYSHCYYCRCCCCRRFRVILIELIEIFSIFTFGLFSQIKRLKQ